MNTLAIMYHDVVEPGGERSSGFAGNDADLYKICRKEFESHLAVMSRAGRAGGSVLQSQGTVLITFDDGGVSAHDRVAAMLEQFGWRGHFFIASDYIGAASFLSREQILDLHARGHVIGSHSCTHPLRISACPWEQLMEEWSRSIRVLSEIVGEAVTVASVPGGHYSTKVAQAAARAGILHLFTSEPATDVKQVEGCRIYGRYTVQRWTSAATIAKIAAGASWPWHKQALLWNAKKISKAVAGEYYVKMRKAILG